MNRRWRHARRAFGYHGEDPWEVVGRGETDCFPLKKAESAK